MTLAEFYRRLAPRMFDLAGGEPFGLSATRTTEILRFNTKTCNLPRFNLLGLYIDPNTRDNALEAYDATVEGSQMYTLDRFGAGALPFDVLVPGIGRGTLRLGRRGGLIMTEEPAAFSFKKPIGSVADLAAVLEQKFGEDVVLVGKAVTLVGMLAAEFVFVFHEGASSYIPMCRDYHRRLAPVWNGTKLHPILRVRYATWDAIGKSKTWLRLPEPLRRPFGAEELSAESFSKRWRKVASEQDQKLAELSKLRRPLALIRYLDENEGGQWSCLATEYQEMQEGIAVLKQSVESERASRRKTTKEWRKLRKERTQAEARLGAHWREKIFRKTPKESDLAKRAQMASELAAITTKIQELESSWKDSVARQRDLEASKDVERFRQRRKSIAFEAELMRMKLIREAVLATDGLKRAGFRPSAWWFPLVSPDGSWFKETVRTADFYLEPLV
jgi:hypothetical protein